jgi:Restriction Enzyme Adenine Methylase Associated
MTPGNARKPTPRGVTGRLLPLIKAGHLRVGEILEHHQPLKGHTFTAVVTKDGFIEIDGGRRFRDPSPALKAYVGHEINGWPNWTVRRTGRRLKDYREMI